MLCHLSTCTKGFLKDKKKHYYINIITSSPPTNEN